MKVAYLILAHTDPLQLQRLARAIDYQADIFIHIDAKSAIEPFRALDLPESATLISERVAISWAGFSMISATLNLMQAALDRNSDYSHFVLLSGVDYPIRSAKVIYQFLVANRDRELIQFFDMRQSPDCYLHHIRYYWFRDALFSYSKLDKAIRYGLEMLLKPLTRRKIEQSFLPCFGSQWWALTPNCATFILDFLQQHPEVQQAYKYTFAPDEHFFHTIVANSPFLHRSNGLQPFLGRGSAKMANLHLIHPTLSKIYDDRDFDEIAGSDKLFVRKVTTEKSSRLLDLIDRELRSASCVDSV
ncbi:beta-1,6-N-acetylglucosaminyltransferase [Leptolyngbya sp. NIES-2104]|uniref:beta-1,6-N-acetylglucosaminyltransferase n=1 Tax=Leptolyngbya sp. NIES-2104 TaxID=1552121 RepID=UPI0006ECBEE6|nr:beta-1,6-N-acetylglucosaminyltransferase [Leptolyngbya sp. NIES-2104]GAP97587.1 EpsK domain protein [Leptolyngbya sp. NIES-2104]